jgi:membrane protease YdiL (CAAX protease family)
MIDAQGIAALDLRIRFGSILLLFLAGVAVSFFALVLCAACHASPSTRILVGMAVADFSWIWGYQLMAEDRSWASLRARFSPVQPKILWACAAGAISLSLFFFAIAKLLMWAGVELPSLPDTDFETGGQGLLPAVFLDIVIIAPVAEELLVRGLLLDWLRQKMAVWPAILSSAVVFGLLHGVALHSGLSGWLQFGFRVSGGILMAYLAVRFQSLRPSLVWHATNNGCAVIASLLFP